MTESTPDVLLRMPEVERLVGLDRTSIYRRIQAGDFPPPLRVGVRRVAWRAADIARWQAERPVAGTPHAPLSRGGPARA